MSSSVEFSATSITQSEISQSTPHSSFVQHRDGIVLIQVDPKHITSKTADLLDFFIPTSVNYPSNENLVVLGDAVSDSDLACFVQAVNCLGPQPLITLSEPFLEPSTCLDGPVTREAWLLALGLCNLWSLSLLKVCIVERIEQDFLLGTAHDLDKVLLGKEYCVKTWYKAGCYGICWSDESVADKYEGKLDLKTFTFLLELRSKRLSLTLMRIKSVLLHGSTEGVDTFDFDETYNELLPFEDLAC